MKNTFRQTLQMAAMALALGTAGFASAQSAPPPPPPPAKHMKPMPHGPHGAHHHKRGEARGDARANGDVAEGSSNAREAAAARQAARQGQLTDPGPVFRENATARCAVFKSEEDRRACVGRVAQGQDSGSVQGGGILREYTYTVPAK